MSERNSNFRPAALVTGGARRIGAAIVRDLAANGFAVAIHCHSNRKEGEALAGEIEAEGGVAAVIGGDLRHPESPAAILEEAQARLGPVQLLVNNASVFVNDRPDRLDRAQWDTHFALHVTAPVLLIAAQAKALRPGMKGLAVNMIDQRVWRLRPDFFSYTLSKSTLWTATRTLAQAYAPQLRVNAIGPGPAMANVRQTAEDFARQQAALLLQRGPRPEEFGRTIRWLWETPSVTGQMIALDGGQHLAWQTPDVMSASE